LSLTDAWLKKIFKGDIRKNFSTVFIKSISLYLSITYCFIIAKMIKKLILNLINLNWGDIKEKTAVRILNII